MIERARVNNADPVFSRDVIRNKSWISHFSHPEGFCPLGTDDTAH
jgi:hypothetical protein